MLSLTHISKTYENKPLLVDVSFTVATGETICLLGASGSGKSTLLRIVAGLESPESGLILWDGADLAPTPPHARGLWAGLPGLRAVSASDGFRQCRLRLADAESGQKMKLVRV